MWDLALWCDPTYWWWSHSGSGDWAYQDSLTVHPPADLGLDDRSGLGKVALSGTADAAGALAEGGSAMDAEITYSAATEDSRSGSSDTRDEEQVDGQEWTLCLASFNVGAYGCFLCFVLYMELNDGFLGILHGGVFSFGDVFAFLSLARKDFMVLQGPMNVMVFEFGFGLVYLLDTKHGIFLFGIFLRCLLHLVYYVFSLPLFAVVTVAARLFRGEVVPCSSFLGHAQSLGGYLVLVHGSDLVCFLLYIGIWGVLMHMLHLLSVDGLGLLVSVVFLSLTVGLLAVALVASYCGFFMSTVFCIMFRLAGLVNEGCVYLVGSVMSAMGFLIDNRVLGCMSKCEFICTSSGSCAGPRILYGFLIVLSWDFLQSFMVVANRLSLHAAGILENSRFLPAYTSEGGHGLVLRLKVLDYWDRLM